MQLNNSRSSKLSSARATALRSWEQRHGGELLRSFKATNVFIILNVDSVLLSVTFYNWFSDMGSILVSTLNINKLQCVNKRSKPIFSPFYWKPCFDPNVHITSNLSSQSNFNFAREGISRDLVGFTTIYAFGGNIKIWGIWTSSPKWKWFLRV